MTISISCATAEKKALRKTIKKHISQMDENYLETSNNLIYRNIMTLPEVRACDRMLIYCSMGREVDTRRLIDTMFEMGKVVALPVCEGKGIMHFSVLNPNGQKIEGMYGILEPAADAEIITPKDGDVIVVPALTFDRKGYRLGKGSGYYDRFLIKRDFFSIGLARDRLLCDSVPTEDHDRKVDCLVTEKNILRLPNELT
ncbi:MAG: 5-formyltetrahydrofolate cyclo-ligase [Clostridiales bacterium]|jgi:5-formyltetrahydrofolate cyclo-ligase|nr:5-formyltetrahydrofolate cyclo-ligase [Clostridiales bacterium]